MEFRLTYNRSTENTSLRRLMIKISYSISIFKINFIRVNLTDMFLINRSNTRLARK